jgi:hypothetical protein
MFDVQNDPSDNYRIHSGFSVSGQETATGVAHTLLMGYIGQ